MTAITTETFGKSRLLPLDLLRGIAALLVALGHFSSYGTVYVGTIVGICVPFFFILSGYVLSHAYGAEIRSGRLGIGEFTIIRLARLYPLHILTAIFVAVFWLSVEASRFVYPLPISETLGFNYSLLETFETFTLTQLLFGGRVSFNTPSWSISVEFWCSLYIFLLCLPGRTAIKTVLVVLSLAGFAAVEAAGGFLGSEKQWVAGFLEKNYVTGLGCFTLGWALRVYLPRTEPLVRLIPLSVWWIFSALAIAAIAWPPIDPSKIAGVELLYYGAFALMIMGLSQTRVASPAMQRLMAAAGDWSYGIYLWHVPLMLPITAVARTIEKVFGVPVMHTVAMDIAFIPLLFIVSALSYRHFELPAKRWLRRRAMVQEARLLQPSS